MPPAPMDSGTLPEPLAPPGAGGKNLLWNYLSLFGGSISVKLLSLVTVLMLTRALTVPEFGKYSLIFSYWAFMNTLVDLGGTQLMTRDVAREPERGRFHVETMIYLRLLGCLVFLPVGYAVGRVLGLDGPWILITWYGLLVGFEALYDAWFSATMNLDLNAKARFFAGLATVGLMAVALWMKASLMVIVVLGLSTPLLKFFFDFHYAPFRLEMHRPDWSGLRRLLKDAWPLWWMGLLFIFVTRIDAFMLQVLSPGGAHDVGIYSAAFRFSEAIALIVNALGPSLLPLLVVARDEPEQVKFLTHTAVRLVLAVVIPISLMIFWYAPWIVKLYGGAYGESAECMRVLVWSQTLVAVNSLYYLILLVYNIQSNRMLILFSNLNLILNVALNWWLIPRYRALGSSWATVVTELVIVLFMLVFIGRKTPLRLFRDIALIHLFTFIACLPVWFMGEAYGVLSVLIFLGLMWATRLLTPDMVRRLVASRLQTTPTNPT